LAMSMWVSYLNGLQAPLAVDMAINDLWVSGISAEPGHLERRARCISVFDAWLTEMWQNDMARAQHALSDALRQSGLAELAQARTSGSPSFVQSIGAGGVPFAVMSSSNIPDSRKRSCSTYESHCSERAQSKYRCSTWRQW